MKRTFFTLLNIALALSVVTGGLFVITNVTEFESPDLILTSACGHDGTLLRDTNGADDFTTCVSGSWTNANFGTKKPVFGVPVKEGPNLQIVYTSPVVLGDKNIQERTVGDTKHIQYQFTGKIQLRSQCQTQFLHLCGVLGSDSVKAVTLKYHINWKSLGRFVKMELIGVDTFPKSAQSNTLINPDQRGNDFIRLPDSDDIQIGVNNLPVGSATELEFRIIGEYQKKINADTPSTDDTLGDVKDFVRGTPVSDLIFGIQNIFSGIIDTISQLFDGARILGLIFVGLIVAVVISFAFNLIKSSGRIIRRNIG